MTISLYNNSSAYNTLYKSMTKLKDVTATIKGACSVDNPTLVIDNPGIAFNYFYIGDFGRYYKVTSRVLSPGQIMLISGVSDPVQSFNSGIAGLDVLAVRCEDLSVRSPELADNAIPLESDIQIDKVTGDAVIGFGSGYIVIGVV
jgi:hypothetical protein